MALQEDKDMYGGKRMSYIRRTGSGFLRLPHARRLEEEIAATMAGDRTMVRERPTLQRGESLEDFAVRKQAWVAGWTADDALEFLDENVMEGPKETKAAKLVRAEVESLRAAVERVREVCTADRRISWSDGSSSISMLDPADVLRALDGEAQ